MNKDIAYCLKQGLKRWHPHIHQYYLDWATINWHMHDRGLPYIEIAYAGNPHYGFIVLSDGEEFEYTYDYKTDEYTIRSRT